MKIWLDNIREAPGGYIVIGVSDNGVWCANAVLTKYIVDVLLTEKE